MQTLTPKVAAIAALVPLALGSLTACGGGDSSAAAGTQQPSSASGTSSGAPSSSSADTSSGSLTGADFLRLMQAAGSKITTVKVDMTGEASGQSYSMKGAMDLTGEKPAMEMTMDMGSAGLSGVQMRLVDGTMYMSLGAMTQNKFVKFDLSDPHSPLGSLSSSLDQLDPSKLMGQMGPGAFKHVRLVGSDSAGKHYHATLVTAKSPSIKGLPSSATQSLPKTMAYDTWLDDEGRFTKFAVSVPNYMKMTAHYTDYGADVNVTAPPASQITQLPGANPSL